MEDEWRYEAACAGISTDLFFPVGNTGAALDQADEAKAICRRCPVSDECLQWALNTGQTFGVWGGLTEDERRDVRRREYREKRESA
ncbi:WhiB family transcriptional regulator [Streptomyces sp. NPDC051643]|uniref:WhiB family transcriptional regulator n=1 Tax=Streptomyces sp. NPDC051643 TaxID=3365665 RepID=UPI003790C3DD